jgi:phosphoenolpyruvate phosphomutase
MLKEKDIEALGKVKMVIYANHGLRAAIKGMETIFAKIRSDGGIDDLNEFIDPVSHIFEIQGVPEMKENEKLFLR